MDVFGFDGSDRQKVIRPAAPRWSKTSRPISWWPLAIVLAASLGTAGCAGFWSHLGYWSGASLVEPEYAELEGQRVAVICVSDGSSYGTGTEDRVLARGVGDILKANVPDIEVVPASEVADWIDKNGWDAIDYREVGRGVKADQVVAIDLVGLSLHQNQSLYKGRAELTITVFDMRDDAREVFRRQLPEISFPSRGYYSTTETNEATFRQTFLRVLARRSARYFFGYDSLSESTLDPADAAG